CGILCHSCGGSPTKRSRSSASERIISFISMSLTRKTESKFQRLFQARKRHVIQRQTNAQPARGVIEFPDQNMSLAQSDIEFVRIRVFNKRKQRRAADFLQTGFLENSREFQAPQINTRAIVGKRLGTAEGMAGNGKRRAGYRPWPKPLLQCLDKRLTGNGKAQTNASQPEKLAERFQHD